MAADTDDLPYWQVNVPPAAREAVCPPFLRDLSAKDRRIVGTPQAAYTQLTWPAIRALVAANRLDGFQRDPLALRRYLAWRWELRARYGSAEAYVLTERLGWQQADTADTKDATSTSTSTIPPAPWNVRVLCNDWPYGFDPRVVHLVVWTPFVFPEDPATAAGDLTPDARTAIQQYVDATFGALPPETVAWFKNWRSLKSVHTVEHFHVLLFDPPPDFVAKVTGGDVPLSQRLAKEKK